MPPPGRGHTPAWQGRVCVPPPGPSPGCRAVSRPAWGTGSPLSAGAVIRLLEVSQGLGCDTVGHRGQRVPAHKLPEHQQCGLGGPGGQGETLWWLGLGLCFAPGPRA